MAWAANEGAVRRSFRLLCPVLAVALLATACGEETTPAVRPERLKVGLVIDSGSENDKGFNEYTLKGARDAARQAGLDFFYLTSSSVDDYERHVESLVVQGADLVMTVGFRMADATANAARRHPGARFAAVDTPFLPGAGCPETVADCYTPEGGLANVTSLMFAEDEVAYLAGVLAACMTKTKVVATVAGPELPSVARFVTGFQSGARSVNPGVVALNEHLATFDDPASGRTTAAAFIDRDNADVIFAVAGNTGTGALLAARESGRMAIGVDVDQYHSYPEVREALLTSAMKNVDVAASGAVKDFAAGRLSAGVRQATLANGGVSLAPHHDWESRIPDGCKESVKQAEEGVKANPSLTGAK